MNARYRAAIALFITIALGFSLCYWFMIRLWPKGSLSSWLEYGLWAVFRGFGPALAAVLAWYYLRGKAGLHELLSRSVRWRFSWRIYLLAILGAVFVQTVVATAGVLFLNAEPHFSDLKLPRLIVIFVAMALIDGPLGEELGWRGFLLPQLLQKYNPIASSLLVGCIWYVWHIPLYLADGRNLTLVFYFQYLISCAALSLIFTWFFLRTKQSALFAIFLHTVSNYSIFVTQRLLFPSLREATADNVVYLCLLVALAIAASITLRKKPQQHEPQASSPYYSPQSGLHEK